MSKRVDGMANIIFHAELWWTFNLHSLPTTKPQPIKAAGTIIPPLHLHHSTEPSTQLPLLISFTMSYLSNLLLDEDADFEQSFAPLPAFSFSSFSNTSSTPITTTAAAPPAALPATKKRSRNSNSNSNSNNSSYGGPTVASSNYLQQQASFLTGADILLVILSSVQSLEHQLTRSFNKSCQSSVELHTRLDSLENKLSATINDAFVQLKSITVHPSFSTWWHVSFFLSALLLLANFFCVLSSPLCKML